MKAQARKKVLLLEIFIRNPGVSFITISLIESTVIQQNKTTGNQLMKL